MRRDDEDEETDVSDIAIRLKLVDKPSRIRRQRKSQEDYWRFTDLNGHEDVFDIATAQAVVAGGNQLLCTTDAGRFVLVFSSADLDATTPPWLDRELSPHDASLWFVLQELPLPEPLKPVPVRDPSDDPSSRLNLGWKPSADPASPPSEGENRGATVVLLPIEAPPPSREKEYRIVQQIKELITTGDFGRSKADILKMVKPIASTTFYRIIDGGDARIWWECYTRRISNLPRG